LGACPQYGCCHHAQRWASKRPKALLVAGRNFGLRPRPYQLRTEEPRYSRRVDTGEIEENDFNLNISRYISTVEPEPEINLGAVHQKLLALDERIRAATDEHNSYLKELRLPPLP
jgi:type I restriction-modification system DNA methylase subunit